MRKAYIASTNKVKVNSVQSVLTDFDVISINVSSGVSNQPLGDSETLLGAINRAKALPNDGLRIGLEGGVSLEVNPYTKEEVLYVINYGALVDENDNIYVAGGAKIPLPDVIKKALMTESKVKDGFELGDVMNDYTKRNDIRSTSGAVGIFTCDMVDRCEMFKHIVKMLYGQYLFKCSNKE